MSASMASLRAEVKNARAEIESVREEGEAALAEKDEAIEMEMTQMRTEWEAAVSEEAKLRERVSTLSDALTKVCGVHLLHMYSGRSSSCFRRVLLSGSSNNARDKLLWS